MQGVMEWEGWLFIGSRLIRSLALWFICKQGRNQLLLLADGGDGFPVAYPDPEKKQVQFTVKWNDGWLLPGDTWKSWVSWLDFFGMEARIYG
jgi:hypothetical protein